jgi:hypothetical protein
MSTILTIATSYDVAQVSCVAVAILWGTVCLALWIEMRTCRIVSHNSFRTMESNKAQYFAPPNCPSSRATLQNCNDTGYALNNIFKIKKVLPHDKRAPAAKILIF